MAQSRQDLWTNQSARRHNAVWVTDGQIVLATLALPTLEQLSIARDHDAIDGLIFSGKSGLVIDYDRIQEVRSDSKQNWAEIVQKHKPIRVGLFRKKENPRAVIRIELATAESREAFFHAMRDRLSRRLEYSRRQWSGLETFRHYSGKPFAVAVLTMSLWFLSLFPGDYGGDSKTDVVMRLLQPLFVRLGPNGILLMGGPLAVLGFLRAFRKSLEPPNMESLR